MYIIMLVKEIWYSYNNSGNSGKFTLLRTFHPLETIHTYVYSY